ncbi:hypothetical protein [Streptomyces sp. NPDC006368]|uniref:hypothetical protein n=1 Tax=Streptomyces sp. NPDC006368 TaxID=3156760 RepID=UPI0033BFA39C
MVRRRISRPALALTALALGGVWCWAVLRLALTPGQSGILEGAVAAGGWGLSLLPVHVAAAPSAGSRKGRRRPPAPLPPPASPSLFAAWVRAAAGASRRRRAGTRNRA